MKEHEQCTKCKIDINTIPILKDLIDDLYNKLENIQNIPNIPNNSGDSLSLTNSPNTTTINNIDNIDNIDQCIARIKSNSSINLNDWDYIDKEELLK